MRIQWSVKLSVVLIVLLGACSDAGLIGGARTDQLSNIQTTQTPTSERSEESWRRKLLQSINRRKWKEIEAMVNAQPSLDQKQRVLRVAIEEIGKIQNDNEAKELFEQAADFVYGIRFSHPDAVSMLHDAYSSRLNRAIDAEEKIMEQALTIAEQQRGSTNPKSIANKLRTVLSQTTYPLEFNQTLLMDLARRMSGLGDGEMADASERYDRHLDSRVTTMNRIIILAIQLDTSDITDKACDRILQSAGKVDTDTRADIAKRITTALKNIAILFPKSQIPQALQLRIRKTLVQG
jgi:hypothetical protein